MPSRAELEMQLTTEIHHLPIDAIEAMLKLALLVKTTPPAEIPKQTNNFADFIRHSPLMDMELELIRDQSLCREITL